MGECSNWAEFHGDDCASGGNCEERERTRSRRGGAFTFNIDIKDETKSRVPDAEWKNPRNPVKPRGSRKMDVDAAVGVSGNQFEAPWNDDDDEEMQCQGCNEGMHQACGMGFHRR